MNKIKILELESSTGFGGQEHRTLRVINGLNKNEFEVFWGLNKGSKSLNLTQNAKYINFNLTKNYNIFTIFELIKFIKKEKIDIIATHSGKDATLGSVAGFLTKTKVVRTRHLQTPISSSFFYNLSTKIVAVSKAVVNGLISQGVKKEKIQLIYTGVNTNKFSPIVKIDIKEELSIPKNHVIVGIVAVLRNAKNHKVLIDAFNELNNENASLIIVGSGPQEEKLKKYTSNNKNIFMLGNRNDVDKILPSFDIFVLPSNMEALGTAILEASSCQVPCIGSDVGGITEAIKDGYSGYIFENENKDALKDKLNKLIQDSNLRKEMGINARKYIEENFSVDVMVKNTENLYKEILKNEN